MHLAAERAGVAGTVSRIWHLGGLNYQVYGSDPSRAVRLLDLPEADQPRLWKVLDLIARIGATYPDRQVSTPRIAAG
jgi:hypothetical protein